MTGARAPDEPHPDEHGPLRPGLPSHQSPLDVVLTGPRPGVVVLGVAGEIDLATAPRLESGIDLAFGPPVLRVVLDLSRVTFLASRGLAVLLDAHRRAAEHNVRLGVVVARAPVRRGAGDQRPDRGAPVPRHPRRGPRRRLTAARVSARRAPPRRSGRAARPAPPTGG